MPEDNTTTGTKTKLLTTTTPWENATSETPSTDTATTTAFITTPWWKFLWVFIRKSLTSVQIPAFQLSQTAPHIPPPHYTWTFRIKNLAWGVTTMVTGSFVVAVLNRTQMMNRAVATSLSWFTALIAITVGLALIFGRTSSDDDGTDVGHVQ
jgi:hypothetical protein